MSLIQKGYLVHHEGDDGRRTYVAFDYAALDSLFIKLTRSSIGKFPWQDREGRWCEQGAPGSTPVAHGMNVTYPIHIYYTPEVRP